MIRVSFNSQELVDNSIRSLDDLPALLATVEDHHLSKDSFIRDVILDGESLVSKGVLDLHRIPAERRERASQINVISSTLYQITHEAVLDAQAYLSELEQPLATVASQFNSGQFRKANHNLAVLLEGLTSLLSLIGNLESNFALELGSVTCEGASVTVHLKDLRSQLELFVRAQEQQDTVTLADLLEYELRPRLRLWKAILTTLWERVETMAGHEKQTMEMSKK